MPAASSLWALSAQVPGHVSEETPGDSSPWPFALSRGGPGPGGAEKSGPCCALFGLLTFRIHVLNEMVVILCTAFGRCLLHSHQKLEQPQNSQGLLQSGLEGGIERAKPESSEQSGEGTA